MMETANADAETREKADIFVEELDMYVTAIVIMPTTSALLSVGELAQDHETFLSWTGMGPILTKPDGTVVKCGERPNVHIIASFWDQTQRLLALRKRTLLPHPL